VRLLRWFAAGLIGTVAGLLFLVGVVLCVTLVLAPLGIPVILLGRKLFGAAGKIVVPRSVRHPVAELDRAGTDKATGLKRSGRRGAKSAAKTAAKTGEKGKKGTERTLKKGKKSIARAKPGKKRGLGAVKDKIAS
jgi:hypothetical protein